MNAITLIRQHSSDPKIERLHRNRPVIIPVLPKLHKTSMGTDKSDKGGGRGVLLHVLDCRVFFSPVRTLSHRGFFYFTTGPSAKSRRCFIVTRAFGSEKALRSGIRDVIGKKDFLLSGIRHAPARLAARWYDITQPLENPPTRSRRPSRLFRLLIPFCQDQKVTIWNAGAGI